MSNETIDTSADALRAFDPVLYDRMPPVVQWAAKRVYPGLADQYPTDRDLVRRMNIAYGRGIILLARIATLPIYLGLAPLFLSGGHGPWLVLGCAAVAPAAASFIYLVWQSRVVAVAMRVHRAASMLKYGRPIRTPKEQRQRRLVMIFLIVVLPLAIMIGCLVSLIHGLHEQGLTKPFTGGVEVPGTIVNVRNDCGRYGCDYEPTIKYADKHGRTYTIVAPDLDEKPRIGTKVRVSYRSADPGDGHDVSGKSTDRDNTITGSKALIVLMLLIPAGSGIVYLRRRRKRHRTARAELRRQTR